MAVLSEEVRIFRWQIFVPAYQCERSALLRRTRRTPLLSLLRKRGGGGRGEARQRFAAFCGHRPAPQHLGQLLRRRAQRVLRRAAGFYPALSGGGAPMDRGRASPPWSLPARRWRRPSRRWRRPLPLRPKRRSLRGAGGGRRRLRPAGGRWASGAPRSAALAPQGARRRGAKRKRRARRPGARRRGGSTRYSPPLISASARPSSGETPP